MKTIKTFIVDAFTDEPFKGNPAGVCLMEDLSDAALMQSIATELNLSETAFLCKSESSDNQYLIRYFTPSVEIAFCGHATLASAKVILEKYNQDAVEFTTHYQLNLSATQWGSKIKMIFPLYDTIPYAPNQSLYQAMGITKPLETRFSKDMEMLVILVKDKQTLVSLNPDYAGMIASSNEIKEVVVTSHSEEDRYDFYSRCFCPWIGINEDPVTGAAHAVLAKYWSEKLAKAEMRAYQVSKRGGYMELNIIDSKQLEVISNAKVILDGLISC
jgi:PhzF family phenazine biosynthesis protein